MVMRTAIDLDTIITERTELEATKFSLDHYMRHNPEYDVISDKQRDLLHSQLVVINRYIDILRQRYALLIKEQEKKRS